MNMRASRPSGGSVARCGRVTANELYNSVVSFGVEPPPLPKPPDKLGVIDSLFAELVGAHPGGSEISFNLFQKGAADIHERNIWELSQTCNGKLPTCPLPGPWVNLFSMLRNLIRTALERKQRADPKMSMRRASLQAGQSETYVRDIIEGRVRDPGIGGILALADVLDIPLERVIEAVQRDLGERRGRGSREAAAHLLAQMTPEELAAFIATQSAKKH